jgi:hypothetical protein
MTRELHVWPAEKQVDGAVVARHAVFEWPARRRSQAIWYRMPLAQASLLSDSADAFAIAAIHAAMRTADRLYVHGSLSPALVANLHEYQLAWHRWRPRAYGVVDVIADSLEEAAPPADARSVLAFSGGLDSCFTLWRHTLGRVAPMRQTLAAGVMVHGFDIPLSQPTVFARAAERSRGILRSVGMDLLTLESNLRSLRDDWELFHGAAILSCLHLFKQGYGGGVIASSHVYESLRFPWGSNPLTDGLLETPFFRVSHDGCGFSRPEKARAVARWSAGMSGLRVCWEGAELDRNCGECLRCVATAICFAVEGVAPPASLAVRDLANAIDRIAGEQHSAVAVTRLAELLELARKRGVRARWVGSLDALVNRNSRLPRFHLPSLRRRVRRLKYSLERLGAARSGAVKHKPSTGASRE